MPRKPTPTQIEKRAAKLLNADAKVSQQMSMIRAGMEQLARDACPFKHGQIIKAIPHSNGTPFYFRVFTADRNREAPYYLLLGSPIGASGKVLQQNRTLDPSRYIFKAEEPPAKAQRQQSPIKALLAQIVEKGSLSASMKVEAKKLLKKA